MRRLLRSFFKCATGDYVMWLWDRSSASKLSGNCIIFFLFDLIYSFKNGGTDFNKIKKRGFFIFLKSIN